MSTYVMDIETNGSDLADAIDVGLKIALDLMANKKMKERGLAIWKYYLYKVGGINITLDTTKIWCVVLKNIDTSEVSVYYDKDSLKVKLKADDKLILHNGIMYDLPVLERLWGIKYKVNQVYDTLLMSRVLEPDREGGHSLEAWGKRVGIEKIEYNDFSNPNINKFDPDKSEIVQYCKGDVEITHRVYNKLQESSLTGEFVRLEHQFAYLIEKQIEAGFAFDEAYANDLYLKYNMEFELYKSQLLLEMPKVEDTTHYKSVVEKGALISESQETYTYLSRNKVITKNRKYIEPNPTSRQQIADYLIKHGWKPSVFTETGLPKVDEASLKGVEGAEEISKMFTLQKKMGMLKDGQYGWLNCVRNGRIHGDVITNGTSTGRCTHCVPMDTQALTKSGWKSYEDLEIGEEILAYDQERHLKVWTPLISKSKFNNKQVGEIGNKSMKFRCTEEHKWVVQSRSRKGHHYKGQLVEANKLLKHHRILVNAPYEFGILDTFECVWDKYNTNYFPYITNYNKSLLSAFLNGFLLADGHFNKSWKGGKHTWYFVQATGHIFDVMLTASYLYWDKRISSYKHGPQTDKHRESNTCLFTSSELMSVRDGMKWVPTTIEDVWCPETKYGTWVMRQGNYITITGNSKPNVAQTDGDPEMRKCWIAGQGKILVGIDAASLELRLLSHYLSIYDRGAFAHEVVDGDVHTYNQQVMGLETRTDAKTAIYALIYGAGNAKLGFIKTKERNELINKKVGQQVRSNIEDNFVGYKQLVDDVQTTFKNRGYLLGLDGRPLYPRTDYSALNLLIQSAGAIVMKQALVNSFKILLDRGYKLGVHYNYVGTVHDEIIIECEAGIEETVKDSVIRAIVKAGEDFKLKCPMNGEGKIGKNWSETH